MKLAEAILEAVKASVSAAELTRIASYLESNSRRWGSDSYEEKAQIIKRSDKAIVEMDYRNYSLFNDRSGEEDDDYPIPDKKKFKELEKTVKGGFKSSGLDFKGMKIRITPQEKSYFTISVEVPYDSSADSLPLIKKPLSAVTPKEIVDFFKNDTDNTLSSILNPAFSKVAKSIRGREEKSYKEYISNTNDRPEFWRIDFNALPAVYIQYYSPGRHTHLSYRGGKLFVSKTYKDNKVEVRLVYKDDSVLSDATEIFSVTKDMRRITLIDLANLITKALSAYQKHLKKVISGMPDLKKDKPYGYYRGDKPK